MSYLVVVNIKPIFVPIYIEYGVDSTRNRNEIHDSYTDKRYIQPDSTLDRTMQAAAARQRSKCTVDHTSRERQLTSWRIGDEFVQIVGVTTCIRDILQSFPEGTIERE